MEKKQTALQTLIAWGDEMLKQHPQKILSFAEAIDKAEELLQMEKEQIQDAYAIGIFDQILINNRTTEEYYNEKYGKETIGNDHHGISCDNPIQYPDSFRYDGC